jgi:hypothetical protein
MIELESKCHKKPVEQISILERDCEWGERRTRYYFYICSECGKPTEVMQEREFYGQ